MHSKRIQALVAALTWCALSACSSKPEASTAQAAEPSPQPPAAKTIRVGIGTQDTTINCATGGPLVRELHLLEKYLPHTG